MFKVKVNLRSSLKDQGLLGGQVSRRGLICGPVFEVKVGWWSSFQGQGSLEVCL